MSMASESGVPAKHVVHSIDPAGAYVSCGHSVDKDIVPTNLVSLRSTAEVVHRDAWAVESTHARRGPLLERTSAFCPRRVVSVSPTWRAVVALGCLGCCELPQPASDTARGGVRIRIRFSWLAINALELATRRILARFTLVTRCGCTRIAVKRPGGTLHTRYNSHVRIGTRAAVNARRR